MTTSRYEARTESLADGGSRVIVIDNRGSNHSIQTFTKSQDDALFQRISDFFDAGVQRYGSVDEFARALAWNNEAAA